MPYLYVLCVSNKNYQIKLGWYGRVFWRRLHFLYYMYVSHVTHDAHTKRASPPPPTSPLIYRSIRHSLNLPFSFLRTPRHLTHAYPVSHMLMSCSFASSLFASLRSLHFGLYDQWWPGWRIASSSRWTYCSCCRHHQQYRSTSNNSIVSCHIIDERRIYLFSFTILRITLMFAFGFILLWL